MLLYASVERVGISRMQDFFGTFVQGTQRPLKKPDFTALNNKDSITKLGLRYNFCSLSLRKGIPKNQKPKVDKKILKIITISFAIVAKSWTGGGGGGGGKTLIPFLWIKYVFLGTLP